MNALHSSNQRYAEDLDGWHEWIGKKVRVSGTKPGILKYFGRTEFADGIWCGVELNEPIGKNNGSVKGVQYFTCKDNHGIFVSAGKVEKIQEKVTWDRNSDGQKKLKSRRFTLHSGSSQGKIGNILPDEDIYVSQSDKRRKTTFFKFPNSGGSGTLTSHSQKPQLNNSYVISSENNLIENADDILNKTMVLTDENMVNHNDQHNVPTNKVYVESNSVLNATFDINNLQAAEVVNNNKEIVLDGTFVLNEQNIENAEGQICNNTSDRANFNTPENDESLCILSLSQMKDFTVCTEQLNNDSSVELQNLHLSDLRDNSKTPRKSSNRSVSRVSSSGFFQTDLKPFQDNAIFEDCVFLNNETENGNNVTYRGQKRGSQDFFSRQLSDEVKDICFEPAHDQSSTPSEESKQMFSKRMSLIKSFRLDDSFKFETKRNSSTPYKQAAPLELASKVDILDTPIQAVEDSLGNVNLSLIDDQTIPSTLLDTTRSIEEEPLKKEKKKSDDSDISDLVSHSVKVGNIPSAVYGSSSNGRKSSGEGALKFDHQISTTVIHSSGLLLENPKQTADTNLNITQELTSDVKHGSISENNFEIPAESAEDAKWTQEGSSLLKGEAFSVSKMHTAVTKPVSSVEKVISAIKKDSESGEICESVSDFSSNSSYCVRKVSSEGTTLDPQHVVSEMEKKSKSDILHQTFNYNSSYTVPLNCSYTLAGNEVNKNEGSAANKEIIAINKTSNESECSLVIDQLHNVPCNEFLPSPENSTKGKKEDCVPQAPQNLNATVCISSKINSHNLTFDVTENSETEIVNANRSNVCTNLTRQSVGPVLSRTNDKIIPSAARPRSALVTNSTKPCVPNNKEQTMPNKFSDSLKQNNVQSQKTLNRRYPTAPRITSQENKMQLKTQVVSKIDTNLKASRLSLPKQSQCPPANTKKQLDIDNSVFKVPDSKTIKNVLNYQRLRQDARKENGLDGSQKCTSGKRNVTTPQNSENKSFILKENTQAVNVPVQGDENGFPTPSLSRRSSMQSLSSQSSSKIAVLNKNNAPKSNETKDFSSKNDQKLSTSTRRQTIGIPPSNQKQNTSRSLKLNDSANSQKPTAPNIKEKQNLMTKKPETARVPGRFSESAGIGRSIPRRTCLPKLKPVQQC